MSQIQSALEILFTKHRIVFWYDEKQELREEFEELRLVGIEKVEVLGNAFGLKHRLLREAPRQMFLLYHAGPQPPDQENWLLDVQLANGVFHADQASLWLSDAGLGMEHWDLVQEHAEFFRQPERRSALRQALDRQDTAQQIRMKMLAVCAGSAAAPRLDDLLEILLEELATGDEQTFREIQDCELAGFWWQQVKRNFNYQSTSPTPRDFCVALFQSCYRSGLGEEAPLNQEALVFIRRWKDSRRYQRAFDSLSEDCAAILNIQSDLAWRPLEALLDMDYFKLIDQRILSELARQVTGRTLSSEQCSGIIHRRRTGHWYEEYRDIYESIDYAAQFQSGLEQADLNIHSIPDGIQKYASTWHRLDFLYRKFIYHARSSRQVSILDDLIRLVENLYNNNYLLRVNNAWQPSVDACQHWETAPFTLQRDFFTRYIQDYIGKQKKVAVIISDGLRYEAGVELAELICAEDRFEADITPAVSMLPSFTQLSMAALLPNTLIALNGDGTVSVDGQSASGIDNRDRILKTSVPASIALRAEQLLSMTRDDSRALFRDHDVVYIYHNQIDQVGDKRESEERVFNAVETTLEEVVDLVKKLASANYTAILVTSDHGFIYQNSLVESDFSGLEVSGAEILFRNRRFVLGKGLNPSMSIKLFQAGELGLTGDLEAAIPKSIHRLRLQGSGSRYVHGGAALQEIVIPVIQIRKKRESDLGQVGVDILRGTHSNITTGQISVMFYQDQPVSSKLQERRLRAGFFAQNGELVSDQHELIFDFTAEDPRQRELVHRFILSRRADAFNEQELVLKLEEAVPDTHFYREYKSARYILRRSFTQDFDF